MSKMMTIQKQIVFVVTTYSCCQIRLLEYLTTIGSR